MLSEPVKALFESNTNARHAGDADRLAKEHKPNGVHVLTDLPYGIPDQLRKLDLYRPETQHEPLPVIIDFHGGGLYHGDKQNTMCRDMYLAKYGFAVVNANYRLVPQIGFQDQLHDALDAIIWTNEHAHDYGMDTNALFLIGDSAATLLILYLTAVLHSPVVASQLGMKEAYGTAHILAIAGCSGMYRFEGGVHGTAMGYYAEGYFPTLKERIRISPYLEVDRLVVDGNLPPFYLQTSTEDYLADNTLEFARILQYRHHDYELRLLPKGLDHALVHDFAVKEVGLEHNEESQQIVKEAATFFKRYRPATS